MGSALEALTPTNSLARRTQKSAAVGRLRARSDHYLWLFGQIHAKVSALEALTPTNSLARRTQKSAAVGRLRARSDHYLWLFGQIHAKVSGKAKHNLRDKLILPM
ncbi:unnamed protein product [Strongylus vulgaris]|uniref:Uncharacterized protein n=1 Tax=Strongylus vulgaris TaxID=40348 RepID=A0A3P7LRQ3_STRVU|nr:unnamed protein product [Strongylus vulgaris]